MDTGVSLRLGGSIKRAQRPAFGARPAAAKPDIFAADSDGEDEASERVAKKQRHSPAGSSGLVAAWVSAVRLGSTKANS